MGKIIMKYNSKNLRMFGAALAICAMAGLASCAKQSTEPESAQANDSQAAADVLATSIGTNSGGAASLMSDALNLSKGGAIARNEELVGKDTPQKRDSVYDPVTMIHTITFTRTATHGMFNFTGNFVYNYTYYDATGATMPTFVKGSTDKIVVSVMGNHQSITPRANLIDSSSADWTITGIASGNDPILNGTHTRWGISTINSPWNPQRVINHTMTINFTNDQMHRDTDGYVILIGTGNSDFKASNSKNQSFERKVNITFNADGTATLDVTRTTGDGTTDTFTIDVKQGFWLENGRR
jgi:hypothetical protein